MKRMQIKYKVKGRIVKVNVLYKNTADILAGLIQSRISIISVKSV